jgi:hypothetical protein
MVTVIAVTMMPLRVNSQKEMEVWSRRAMPITATLA